MKARLKRIIDQIYGAPPRFAGGLILNLLGYQIVRMLLFRASYLLRNRRFPNDAKLQSLAREFHDNGIVVIPDFFPPETFKKIVDEAQKTELPIVHDRAPRIERITVVSDGNPNSNPLFKEHFAKNPVVNALVAMDVRKDVLVWPKIQIEVTSYAAEDIGKETTDLRSDEIHYDRSFPTVRTFFYLTDVDEHNGALRYARRSHKLTLSRLTEEYKMSVAFYRSDKEMQENVTPSVDPRHLEKRGLRLESMSGKANTMVIADTMGYHRRGDFSTTTKRGLIVGSFGPLESLRYLRRKLFGLTPQ